MDDYGYFGKGLSGYVHYNEAFKRNNGGGGKPPSNAGCFTLLMVAGVIVWII